MLWQGHWDTKEQCLDPLYGGMAERVVIEIVHQGYNNFVN